MKEVVDCKNGTACKAPFFFTKRLQDLRFSDRRSIDYDLTMKNSTGSTFAIAAVLNIGWCKDFVRGTRLIKNGDYHTIGDNLFQTDSNSAAVVKNFEVFLFGGKQGRS